MHFWGARARRRPGDNWSYLEVPTAQLTDPVTLIRFSETLGNNHTDQARREPNNTHIALQKNLCALRAPSHVTDTPHLQIFERSFAESSCFPKRREMQYTPIERIFRRVFVIFHSIIVNPIKIGRLAKEQNLCKQ